MMANRAAPHVTEVSGRYAIYLSNLEVVERSGDAPAVERRGRDRDVAFFNSDLRQRSNGNRVSL